MSRRWRYRKASASGRSGQLQEAIEEFTRQLDDRRRVLGDEHPDTLQAGDVCASWLRATGWIGSDVR